MTKKFSVFISYNKADRDAANEIAHYLDIENIVVKFDEWEIAAGDSITQWMDRSLQDCTHFIILWSKNSSKSNWVHRELYSVIARAISSNGLPKVLPIRLDNKQLPSLLADLYYLRYKNNIEEDRLEIIKAVTGQKPLDNYIYVLEKKREEFLSQTPMGYICPSCSNINLKSETRSDSAAPGGLYEVAFCEVCGWEDIIGC